MHIIKIIMADYSEDFESVDASFESVDDLFLVASEEDGSTLCVNRHWLLPSFLLETI